MALLERNYQPKLVERIKAQFPGCVILKNDSQLVQGIPDWTIFWGPRWAMFEVKRTKPTKESDWQPNQQYYLDQMNRMGFAICIYPENETEAINELRKALTSRG